MSLEGEFFKPSISLFRLTIGNMNTPKFSILIPTRDRPVTFRHTLQTVLTQTGDDFEIIVADNCSSPAVAQIVQEAQSAKIKYFRSDEILPMTENWEKGLKQCTGEYVTILGDDDGLVPSTLTAARLLLNNTQAKVLNWALHTYWWPDTIVYWNSNRLNVTIGSGAHWYTSESMLNAFYEGAIGFDRLPMIYSSFVHRDCIDAVVKKYGAYFNLPQVPDVVSGVLNLLQTDRVLFSQRPLSIRGNSGKSNGTAQWARSLGEKQRETYFREERAHLQEIIHPSLVPSPNLNILIASIKIQCKELFFPERTNISVSIPNLVKSMIDSLNTDPDSYDDNLEEAKALAKKHGLDLVLENIPKKGVAYRKKYSGPLTDSTDNMKSIVVNCDMAGIQDVHAAARLADAMLPSCADSYPGLNG